MPTSVLIESADSWSIHAEEYTKLVSGITPVLTSTLLRAADSVRPFSTATYVLDDGCGSGQVTSALIKEYGTLLPEHVSLQAADFSAGMVEQLMLRREREIAAATETANMNGTAAKEVDLWRRVRTSVLDAQNLEGIEDGSVSHVLGSLCFIAIPDEGVKALAECHRVLVPGGVLAASSWGEVPWLDVARVAGTTRDNHKEFEPMLGDGPWTSMEGVKGLFERAGFKDVKCQTVEVPTKLPPDPKMFFNRLVRSNNPGLRAWFKGWSKEQLDRAVDLIVKEVRRRYGDGQVTLMGSGIVAVGRK